MKHQAWLDTAPIVDEKKQTLGVVRREDPRIPDYLKERIDVVGGTFLIDRTYDAGLCSFEDNGFCMPIKWSELLAWKSCADICLTGYELEIIKSLSSEYASFRNKAKHRVCLSPTETKEEYLDRLSR